MVFIRITKSNRKTPTVPFIPKGFSARQGLVLAGLELLIKPLANAMSYHICCDGQRKGNYVLHEIHLLSMKMGRSGAALTGYHKLRPKATQARRMTFGQNF